MDAALWTQLECHIGLIASCFPAVNQVFRKWVAGDATSAQGKAGREEVEIESVGEWMENGAQMRCEMSEEIGMDGQVRGACW